MSETPSPSSRFARLAAWSYDNRGKVFLAWIVTLVAVFAIGSSIGKKEVSDFRLPGTESQRAYDLLGDHFPAQNGTSDQFVFRATRGKLTDATNRSRIESALTAVGKVAGVQSVSNPLARGGQLSKDATIGVATVNYKDVVDSEDLSKLKSVEKRGFEARGPTLQVEHGGQGAQIVRYASQQDPSFAIGFLAAAIVLVITFGSLVAAGATLGTAVLSLLTTLGLIYFTSHVVDTPDFATQLAELIGLGVGIDYALFVLTRYRSEVKAGRERRDAIVTAMDTAGRTVFFAACTVIIALLGLLLLGLNFMQGVAVGAALAVLLTMFGALTLLPAFVRIAGDRIDGFLWMQRRKAARVEKRTSPRVEGHRWESWSTAVQRRPWVAVILSGALLVALAIPVTQMRLGSSDAGVDPAGTTTKKAYDLVADGFGPGVNGSFLLATQLPSKGDTAAAQRIVAAVKADDQIFSVGTPQLSPDGRVATIVAFPKSGPQDAQTTDTLKRLRDDVLPPVEKATGAKVEIGGQTASTVDFTEVIAGKLPVFVAVVVLLSALLLLCVFRSVLIPIKAAVMNLLSIGAALGVITLVFQEGNGAGLLGIGTGPVEGFFPVMLFAVVFGLSMDYEVFLISRVHEEWERSHDAHKAVARGLATTGRVITAAASIMIVVFAAFALGDDRIIKMFGIGLASAVFLDAIVIRCVLVPAIMELLGERAWWIPKWLDRVLPRMALENPSAHQEPRPTNRPATDVA